MLFRSCPSSLSSPSRSTVTNVDETQYPEMKAILEILIAMENLLSWGSNDREVEDCRVRDHVPGPLDTGKGKNMCNQLPCSHSSHRNQCMDVVTSEPLEWESRVTAIILMALESMLSDDRTGQEVDMKYEVSRSPLVHWSH